MGDRYAGKSVIVTGAGNGIGLAYAEAFAAEGAAVAIADIDADAAAAAAAGIPGALAVTVDVADEPSVAAMVDATVDRFGGVDVLVNNAGLHMGQYNLTSTLPLEDWRRLFDVNLFGSVLCARYCRPSMVAPGMVASDAVLARLEDVHKEAVLGAQLVKRWGRVEDLVGMVLLLCSDDASFATGQTVTVDGGFVKRI